MELRRFRSGICRLPMRDFETAQRILQIAQVHKSCTTCSCHVAACSASKSHCIILSVARCVQSSFLTIWPPRSKNADFDRFPLIASQPSEIGEHSIMTNRKVITGFPTSYRRSVHTLPLSSSIPQEVAQKAIFCFQKNKIQFQSNKVCYKVSLCETFQRRRCSITIPPSNGP